MACANLTRFFAKKPFSAQKHDTCTTKDTDTIQKTHKRPAISNLVSLINERGDSVAFRRYKRRKHDTAETTQHAIQQFAHALLQHDVSVNDQNLRKLGFGTAVVTTYLQARHATQNNVEQTKPTCAASPESHTQAIKRAHVKRTLAWFEDTYCKRSATAKKGVKHADASGNPFTDTREVLRYVVKHCKQDATVEGSSTNALPLGTLATYVHHAQLLNGLCCASYSITFEDVVQKLVDGFASVGIDVTRTEDCLFLFVQGRACGMGQAETWLQQDRAVEVPTRTRGLDHKLLRKWTTSFDELQTRAHKLFLRGLADPTTTTGLCSLVVALCLTLGARRAEIIQTQYVFAWDFHRETTRANAQTMLFGCESARYCLVPVGGGNATLLARRMVRQIGVAKNGSHRISGHTDCPLGHADHISTVTPRTLDKPSLFLTNEEVHCALSLVRSTSLSHSTIDAGCAVVFRDVFGDLVQFSDAQGVACGPHATRSLYARACFGMFVRHGMDAHVFTAAVLGHTSDLKSSIHYLFTHVDVAKPWFAMSDAERCAYVEQRASTCVKKEETPN